MEICGFDVEPALILPGIGIIVSLVGLYISSTIIYDLFKKNPEMKNSNVF